MRIRALIAASLLIAAQVAVAQPTDEQRAVPHDNVQATIRDLDRTFPAIFDGIHCAGRV